MRMQFVEDMQYGRVAFNDIAKVAIATGWIGALSNKTGRVALQQQVDILVRHIYRTEFWTFC